MNEEKIEETVKATPHKELIEQILDSRVPKNEREWAAGREIVRVVSELEKEKGENVGLRNMVSEYQASCKRWEEIVEREKEKVIRLEKDYEVEKSISIASIENCKKAESLLEKEKEQTDYFRLETNRLTDELAKEKERADELDTELRRIRLGMEGDYGDDPVKVIEALKEKVIFWVESYDEELAHSKQAEGKVRELDNRIEKLGSDSF